jgi:hypothetical protein
MKWPASGVKTQKDVKVEHLLGCTKCHLPQLADATDKVAQEILTTIDSWQTGLEEEDDAAVEKAKSALTSLNINCVICHNRNAIIHKWTDGYAAADTVYGSQAGEHPDPRFPKMAKGAILSESIFCGQCHGLGPNLELHNPPSALPRTAAISSHTSPKEGTRPARNATCALPSWATTCRATAPT